MPAVGNVRWSLLEQEDGSYYVHDQHEDDTPGSRSFGHVRFTEQGWVAHAASGETYGPFTTLDEAAYPLALRYSGAEADAALLLGPGQDADRPPALPPLAPEVAPARRFSAPPPRLIFWLVAGVGLLLVSRALPKRGRNVQAVVVEPITVRGTARRRPV